MAHRPLHRSPLLRIVAATLLAALRPGAPALAGSLSDYATLQIVAHEDDDILFMNPDLRNMIAAGYGAVTVYLTAGESVGSADGTQSRERFAASRQEGERAAYAAMAGIDNVPGAWDRSTLVVRGGNVVEVDTLVAAPQVQLIFMNLPDGGDDLPENNLALLRLHENEGENVSTLVPEGTPITRSYSYSREELVGSLVDILEMVRPSVVRTLDPHPMYRGTPPGDVPCTDPVPPDFVSDDNPDHVFAARFAGEALERYRGRGGCEGVSVLHYLGYSVPQHAGNLGAVEYTWKRGICDAYKQWDRNFQQYENCYLGFFGATYTRYPGGTNWLLRQTNGLLAAFAAQHGGVVMWSERTAGGAWRGPISLGGGPVAPNLAIGTRPDGRLQVFATRLPGDRGHGADEVIFAIQTSPGSAAFGSWESLDSPVPSQWTGSPAVAPNADGRLQIFVRNAESGVSTRWELIGGGWSGWLDLGGGPEIIDGLAATISAGGRIELFATTRFGRIAHWYQVAPNDIFTFDATFPTPEAQVTSAASPPTVTYNQDGRLEVFYRAPGTAEVWTAYQAAVDGHWSTNLVPLQGDAGLGPIAAMRHEASGVIQIFARNAFGGVSGTAQVGPNNVFELQWLDLGGLIPQFPAAAVDGAGRTVLATIGIDGRPYLRRQQSASPTAAFGPWFPAVEGDCGGAAFRRGDCNGDGSVTGSVADAVFLLGFLFLGQRAPPCLAACDANGDGGVIGSVADAVFILAFNFLGGPAPPAPFPACGPGTAADGALGCEGQLVGCP